MIKILIILFFVACSTQQDIQVERTRLTFDRVEELYRDGKELFAYYWTDDNREVYVEYCATRIYYPKGYTLTVLLKR